MAGSKIRGITIELSADATGLMDSLKNINSEIKSTGSQLKDVDRLLKLDPTNTTLLTQKTQLLQEQITNTKTKLEELKKAQADMDANGVDKNSEQYQALQREIIATEQELEKLEKTAGSGSAALAKISAVTGEVGEKMEAVGKKVSVVSAAVTAFGVAAVKSFKDVDEGADIVIKKTGATGEAAEEMEQIYKNLAGSVMGDFTEIGNAVGEVATRFQLQGEELESTAEIFQKFAYINDTDVVTAIDNVQKAMSAFGLSAADTETLLNVMNKAGQDTGVSMDSLASNLVINATALQEMGLDAYQAAVFMAQLETSGADSSAVLTGLKKALYNATQEGKTLDEALAELEQQVLASGTSTEALNYVYDLFGSKAAPAVYQALKNGTLSFTELASSMGITEAAMNSINGTYDQTLDGTDKMTLAWKNMQLMLAELGEAIGNTLAPIMERITTAIQNVTKWFSNLDEGTKETIVTIGLIVAAIGPLLVVGGKVLKGISSITGALSSIGTTAAGPIGLAIAAVAALTAGILALTNSWSEAFKEASPFTEALEDIAEKNESLASSIDNTKSSYENTVEASEANAAAAEYLSGKLQELISGYDGTAGSAAMIEGVIEQLNSLVPGLGLSWDSVTNSLSMTNEEIYENIEAMKAQAQVAALQEMYTESLKEQYQAQHNAQEATQLLKDVLDRYGLTIRDVTALQDGSAEAVLNLENKIVDSGVAFYNVGDAIKEVSDAYVGCSDALTNAEEATNNVTFAEEKLGEAMTVVAQQTAQTVPTIQGIYQETFGTAIPEALNTSIIAAQNAGIQIPDTLVKGLNDGQIAEQSAIDRMNALVDFQTAIEAAGLGGLDVSQSFVDSWLSGEYSWTDANNYLNGLVQFTQAIETAQQGGVELTGEFVNGLLNDAGLSSVISAADQLGETAKPTIVANEIQTVGASVPENLSAGMESEAAQVASTAGQIADDIANEFAGTPAEMNEAGSESGSQLNSGFDSYSDIVAATVDDMYEIFYATLGVDMPPLMYKWGYNSGSRYDTGLSGTQSAITATIRSIAQGIKAAVSELPYQMQTAGSQAGQGLYNGLASWQGTLSNLAWSIANSINAAARAALQIRSPSKIMQEVGEYTGEGLEIGLEKSGKGILKTASDIIDTLTDTFDATGINTGIEALNNGIHTSARATAARESNSDNTIATVKDILVRYLPYLAADKDIRFDDGTWAGVLAPSINQELEALRARSARG